MTDDPWARPAVPPSAPPLSQPPAAEPAPPPQPPDGATPPPERPPFVKRMFGDPLSIVLVVVIVVALTVAGLVGGELYARHRASDLVATATACVVQDGASATFGGGLFLPQYFSSHYDDISISTAGNQVRQAKGMKADIDIRDVRNEDGTNSKGTIGSLDATISWTADGIKQTVQGSLADIAVQLKAVIDEALNRIPLIGSLLGNRISAETVAKSITIDSVTTDPSAGTLAVAFSVAGFVKGGVTVKPVVQNQALTVQVSSVTVGGEPIPRELLQDPLSQAIEKLTDDYPLGIRATGVQVTDAGVVATFGTKNASIPNETASGCFAGL